MLDLPARAITPLRQRPGLWARGRAVHQACRAEFDQRRQPLPLRALVREWARSRHREKFPGKESDRGVKHLEMSGWAPNRWRGCRVL